MKANQAQLGVVVAVAVTLAVMLMPTSAHAAGFDLPILDQIMCPIMSYFKSKFAVLAAVAQIIFILIGKQLGWIKDWEGAVTIAVVLALVNAVPILLVNSTGAGNICPGVI